MRAMGKIASATVIITNQIARMEDVSNHPSLVIFIAIVYSE